LFRFGIASNKFFNAIKLFLAASLAEAENPGVVMSLQLSSLAANLTDSAITNCK
jgi:hypothetical protein